jgi:NADH-quinone oxidoreductase subunit L
MILVILPLLGFLFSIFSRKLGKLWGSSLPITTVALSLLITTVMFKKICLEGTVYIYQFEWITIANLKLEFVFLLDYLSVIMSLLITLITLLVMIYSYGYLNEDPSLVRFQSFLGFFCFSMLMMVTAGNYVQFFIGWEGVGLASYLLISFWISRNDANRGALKAIIVNRIGDVAFMIALGLMWTGLKSFDFKILQTIYPEYIENQIGISILGYNIAITSLIAFFLLIAACAKSAQLFLHTWLPDAMEGPTPVSSLLHSATMVTAGVFLIIRSSFIFSVSPNISNILSIIGILTGIVAGLIGICQYDIKRIIAYSTCSQLGFMMFTAGLGHYSYAFFHLITHAFFKCLLFLCSGAIIHALGDEQDIRKMGKLASFLPLTYIIMLIGTFALIGFPTLSGYYSKDLLLETTAVLPIHGTFIFILALFSAFLTSMYSMRLIYYVFFNHQASFFKSQMSFITDAPLFMLIPMIILTLFAIAFGDFFKDILTGPLSSIFWADVIILPIMSVLTEHENLHPIIKLLPSIAVYYGLFFGFIFYQSPLTSLPRFRFILPTLTSFFRQKLYIDRIYNLLFANFVVFFGYIQYKLVDRGFLEILGPSGLSAFIKSFALSCRTTFHNGNLVQYLYILAAAAFFSLRFILYTHVISLVTIMHIITLVSVR